MNVIPSVKWFSSNWYDIFDELNTPVNVRERVKDYFVSNGANTPYQLLGQLLIESFPEHNGGFYRRKLLGVVERYMGKGVQYAPLVFQIRRTLFYVVSVCDDLFGLQLLYEFDDFLGVLDELEPESGTHGGNKKKRSAKRKSSKKRSTRSKK